MQGSIYRAPFCAVVGVLQGLFPQARRIQLQPLLQWMPPIPLPPPQLPPPHLHCPQLQLPHSLTSAKYLYHLTGKLSFINNEKKLRHNFREYTFIVFLVRDNRLKIIKIAGPVLVRGRIMAIIRYPVYICPDTN